MIAFDESFYARDPVTVARALLGQTLVHGERQGRIVEVEAYLGQDDLAAHASRGVTERTKVIFGPPGRAYVYLIYGMYECLNVVTEAEGTPGCVLIRGLEAMAGVSGRLDGPGKLTRAMGIDRRYYGHRLWEEPLRVVAGEAVAAENIVVTPRIGISQCVDWPLRFVERGPGPGRSVRPR